jgi:hypothetical protein
MTVKNKNPLPDIKEFETNTNKEVGIWDWLARILPLAVLAILVILKFMRWDTALDLFLDAMVWGFFVICAIWWYWAIHKISLTIQYMRQSQEKFVSLTSELKKFKEIFKNIKNTPQDK